MPSQQRAAELLVVPWSRNFAKHLETLLYPSRRQNCRSCLGIEILQTCGSLYLQPPMLLALPLTVLPVRLMDKTLHHRTWWVGRPLFNTPVLILPQSARRTSLDNFISWRCCRRCVNVSMLRPGVKGGRARWCKVLFINRHILRFGHDLGRRTNIDYNDCKFGLGRR